MDLKDFCGHEDEGIYFLALQTNEYRLVFGK